MAGPLSLGGLLRRTASAEPGAVAFVEGDRTLNYAEWDARSDAVAADLRARGLAAGEVVALLLPPTIAYPVAFLGAAKAGLVTAGINPRLGEREIGHILGGSGAAALVTTKEFSVRAEPDRPQTLRHVLDAADLLSARGEAPPGDAGPDDPVAIVYTSGSTGLPRGATYTAAALEEIRRVEAWVDAERRPKGLAATPLAHMGFMTKIASFIDRAACSVLVGRWSAREALEIIERERITHIGGVPTQLALMLLDPEVGRFDLSSLRSCLIGGAPASPDLVRHIRERLHVPVTVRYSCTEVGLATGTRADDPDEVVAATVGRPLPTVDLAILDPETRRTLPPGRVGEIAVRSPAMMRDYWRDPAATEASIDAAGYFLTGDLGELDAAGYLRLRGRTKEMYIRGGYNVYPIEVEAVLREHPKVGLAAVVGIPDPVLGERGMAFVVPRAAADPPTPEELRAFVAARIADYKVPDGIEVRAELPLTTMFKVDKAALGREAGRSGTR